MSSVTKHRQDHSAEKSVLWNILKVGMGVALFGFILSQTSFSELRAVWQGISIPWLGCSTLAFCALTWSMARRYWILIDRKIAFRQTLGVVIIQTVVGNLLATSAGAASYITLLRSKYHIPVTHGVISVLLSRFGDGLTLLVALTLSSWALWTQIVALHWIVVLVIIGLFGLVVSFAAIFILRQRIVIVLNHALRLLYLDQISIVDRVSNRLSELSGQNTDNTCALFGPFLGYSSLTLVLTFVFGYCNMRLFRVPIGLCPVIFIISLTQLISIVPVQVFGGLGTYDITTIYLYSIFGVSQPVIIPVVVGLRIYFYLLNLLLLAYLPIAAQLDRGSHVDGSVV